MDEPCEDFDRPGPWSRTADRPGRFELPCSDPVLRRIAAIGKDAAQVQRFERLLARDFVPSASIREGLGTGSTRILVDGFAQAIGDSLSEPDDGGNYPPITQALEQTADTLRCGAGVGIDFSRLRPAGSKAGIDGCRAGGPAAFLRLFEQLHNTVVGADGARGHFTAALSIDHPDIEAFMAVAPAARSSRCVLVTSAFVIALLDDAAFELRFDNAARSGNTSAGSDPHRSEPPPARMVRARELWHGILSQSGDRDLGLTFTDRAHARNGLSYCEWLEAPSSPGGPMLPAYGAMPQGTLMLPAFLVPFGPREADFDHDAFGAAVEGAVEFLDRVVDVTDCPLREQLVELHCKRRIGLGCSGLREVLAAMHQGPATIEGMGTSNAIWQGLRDHAVKASVDLAKAHGPFPLFHADRFPCPGGHASTLSDIALLETIHRHGIRNSHLLFGSFGDNEGPNAMRPRNRQWLSAMAAGQMDGGLSLPLRITRSPTPEQASAVLLRAWQAGATSVLLQRRKRLPPNPSTYCFEEAAPEVLH